MEGAANLDKGAVVDTGESGHAELAVETVHSAAVPRNEVVKVFDLESALEAAGEEAAKGCNQRGKDGHENGVHGQRVDGEGVSRDAQVAQPRRQINARPLKRCVAYTLAALKSGKKMAMQPVIIPMWVSKKRIT